MSSEISPVQFKQDLEGGRRPWILDVRRPEEWEVANLSEYGAHLIPLHELQARFGEIPKEADIVVHCKAGVRSLQAQSFLEAQGYPRVQNLTGGLMAYAEEVDPSKAV